MSDQTLPPPESDPPQGPGAPAGRPWIRRPLTWVAAGGGLVVLVVALALFQPWKLFVDEVVVEQESFSLDELSAEPTTTAPQPTTTAPASSPAPEPAPETTTITAAPPPPPAEPVLLSDGQLQAGATHPASGRVAVVELPDGRRILRFEGLATDNGPDLFVYLSEAPAGSDDGAFDAAGYVDLGPLKGNVGDQTYDIPADVDLSRFQSAIIWCDRFSTVFGSAPVAVQAG